MTMLQWLNGKKTYLGLIASGILGIAWSQGWIDEKTAEMLAVIIGSWTGVAIKHAWDKSEAAKTEAMKQLPTKPL